MLLPIVRFLTDTEKRYYQSLFDSVCPSSATFQLPTGQAVAELFAKSGLSSTIMARIWDMLTMSSTSSSMIGKQQQQQQQQQQQFDQNTFNCGLRLIAMAQQSREPNLVSINPSQSPESLLNNTTTSASNSGAITQRWETWPLFEGYQYLLDRYGYPLPPLDCPWRVSLVEQERFSALYGQAASVYQQSCRSAAADCIYIPFSVCWQVVFHSAQLPPEIIQRIWYTHTHTHTYIHIY
jgi:hypothetical protein